MEWKVIDRVLHGIYRRKEEIPTEWLDAAKAYEGALPNTIGWNLPMSFLYRIQPTSFLVTTYGDCAEYVVVYRNGDWQTKLHELRHARYAMDAHYRTNVDALWDSLSHVDQRRVERKLERMMYPKGVWRDEFQAYYFTEPPTFFGLCSLPVLSTKKKKLKRA